MQCETGSILLEFIGSNSRGRRTTRGSITTSTRPQLALYLELANCTFSFAHTNQGDFLGNNDSLSFALRYVISQEDLLSVGQQPSV